MNADHVINLMRQRRARLVGGYTSDTTWSITYYDDHWIRSAAIPDTWHQEITLLTESEVRSVLALYGQRIVVFDQPANTT